MSIRRPNGPRPASVRPLVPSVPGLQEAMGQAQPLVDLMRRLQASQACLRGIESAVPAPLFKQLRAGPLDEAGWTILVASAAVAAKLRQLQPRLLQVLTQQGQRVSNIRIRVQHP